MLQLLDQHCSNAIVKSLNSDKRLDDLSINVDLLNSVGFLHTRNYMNQCTPCIDMDQLFSQSQSDVI